MQMIIQKIIFPAKKFVWMLLILKIFFRLFAGIKINNETHQIIRGQNESVKTQ